MDNKMQFQEIFNEDGLYVSNSFQNGTCFEIIDGTLYIVTFVHKHDLSPKKEIMAVYKGLFNKYYKKVYNIASLFE